MTIQQIEIEQILEDLENIKEYVSSISLGNDEVSTNKIQKKLCLERTEIKLNDAIKTIQVFIKLNEKE